MTKELYNQMRKASRDVAIRLGVEGNDAAAIAERASRAARLNAECDRRYGEAHGLIDPEPDTFALGIIQRAGGDLTAIAADDALADEVARSMGAIGRSVFVADEDGARWEWSEPTDEAVAHARIEHARIVAALIGEATEHAQ